MKLKLAKWCSIIPLFVYALLIAAATLYSEFLGNTTIDVVINEQSVMALHREFLGNTTILYLFELVSLVSMVLSIYVMPFLAVLGFVLSLILIFQKERKAIKFLVLSFVEIIIFVLLILVFFGRVI